MENLDPQQIKKSYSNSGKRLFFLDYEGTLVSDLNTSDDTVYLESLQELLFRLTSDTNNEVIVISNQRRENLEDCFSELPLTLVAENGGFFRVARNQWEGPASPSVTWKDTVHKALSTLISQYPGSIIESKHFSMAWHYSTCKIEENEMQQLQVVLRSLAKQHHLVLHDDNQVVEFVTPDISKGKFASHWVISHGHYDFILAMGDDRTDEDLFETIGNNYFTIKVGDHTNSSARYHLQKREVLPFLSSLISIGKEHRQK